MRRARPIAPPAAVPAMAPGLRVEEGVAAAVVVSEALGRAVVTTVLWICTVTSSTWFEVCGA
jgi:hypothetical protein